MKRIKYLIVLLLSLLFIPNVFALNVSTRITGNTSINIGDTTDLYVRVDSAYTVRGADVSFSASGATEIISVQATGGMLEQPGGTNNRRVLYSSSGVISGEAILVITVRGIAAGTGTLSIDGLSATVVGNSGLETAISTTTAINILVNDPTQTGINNQVTAQMSEEEKAREALINKAKLLTEASQKSLNEDDYKAAIETVSTLEDGELKIKLLKDLEDVRFKIAVNNATADCKKEKECNCPQVVTSKKWIVLTAILTFIALIEFVYIVISKYTKKEEESIEPIVIKPIEAAKITRKEEVEPKKEVVKKAPTKKEVVKKAPTKKKTKEKDI